MSAIWTRPFTLDALQAMSAGTAVEALGIRFADHGDDWVSATMPVDARHVQPFGVLHGGVSVVLAETLGSMGAALCLREPTQTCVGLDINANHLRAVPKGSTVTGVARPVHLGGRTQVWSIEIRDEQARLACITRLTMAVLDGR